MEKLNRSIKIATGYNIGHTKYMIEQVAKKLEDKGMEVEMIKAIPKENKHPLLTQEIFYEKDFLNKSKSKNKKQKRMERGWY